MPITLLELSKLYAKADSDLPVLWQYVQKDQLKTAAMSDEDWCEFVRVSEGEFADRASEAATELLDNWLRAEWAKR
jgi:hypothetical protein